VKSSKKKETEKERHKLVFHIMFKFPTIQQSNNPTIPAPITQIEEPHPRTTLQFKFMFD
jgi:hypothetical protein